MSALSYLCGYGYGSNSDSEGELEEIRKRRKLPAPDLSKVLVVPKDDHVDDPELHGGRTRTFPHERGNWATYVYLKYPEEDTIHKLVNKLQQEVLSIVENCQICEDFHISLSRTVVLKYHLITPFTSSLQSALEGFKSFELSFESVKVYCNDDNTRTFIALNVDHISGKYLLNVTEKIDEVLQDYSLPTFYADPSFHMSILWLSGDKKAEIENILESLNDILAKQIEKSLKIISVNKVNCKSGNRYFQYTLA